MAAAPPPKPWERNRAGIASSLGPASAVGNATSLGESGVNTSQTAINSAADAALTRPVPSRPWERTGMTSTSYSQPYGTSPYQGSSTGMYGGGYGSSYPNQYGSMGGLGGSYGNSYGNSYGSSYGSNYGMGGGVGAYGRPMYGGYGGSSMYGGYGGSSPYNNYSSGINSPMYGGMNGLGNSFGQPGMLDPNNPTAQPPTAWQHFLMAMNGALQFFGKICFLVDENTHAFHFFINALLQLLDRAGSLYGELARFVLRLLRRKRSRVGKELVPVGPGAEASKQGFEPQQGFEQQNVLVPHNTFMSRGPVAASSNANTWDGLWKD